MEKKNNTPVLTTEGNNLIALEPPASIYSLTWNGPDTLKEKFLNEWNTYYTLSERRTNYNQKGNSEGNVALNQLSILDEMQQLLEEGKLDVTNSYEELVNKVVDLVLERDCLISDESQRHATNKLMTDIRSRVNQ